jgi:peptidylprolyl isomerase
VIPGFDQGFAGMKVGGQRRLFIPWQLAYGAKGRPGPEAAHPGIPPKADLIFDVELVDVTDLPTAPARSTADGMRPMTGAPAAPARPNFATPSAPGATPNPAAPAKPTAPAAPATTAAPAATASKPAPDPAAQVAAPAAAATATPATAPAPAATATPAQAPSK